MLEVDVVPMLVVEDVVVVVVVSHLLQVLSHRAAKMDLLHRPTASKSLHCFKGDLFTLPLHRSVVVIAANALLAVEIAVAEEILARLVIAVKICKSNDTYRSNLHPRNLKLHKAIVLIATSICINY